MVSKSSKKIGTRTPDKLYEPQGTARELFTGPHARAEELVLSGPAGTGKSRACLEKILAVVWKYPGCRILVVRKTRSSLTNTGQVTWEQWVLPPNTTISLHSTTQSYAFPNGSLVVLGGLDKASKIMSAEYDIIFVQEATELTITDWESLLTRLRNGKVPYQQIIADCNPDAPSHWLHQRSLPYSEVDDVTGQEVVKPPRLNMLTTSHEDNPRYYNPKTGVWTERGLAYLRMLDNLTGVRKDRLRWGIWTAAEGAIYTEWEAKDHLIDREKVVGRDQDGHDITMPVIQPHWLRYWVVDFGYKHPFVWQAWAEDPDGRLYRYREIHMTERLVSDHCKKIKEVTKGEPLPVAIITDHDLEGRMTIERELGMKTIPAYKSVQEGIQAVHDRLRKRGDGTRGLYLLRDSLVEIDKAALKKKQPISTEQEITSYVWHPESANYKKQEMPIKVGDDGCDGVRYMVAYKDCRGANQGSPVAGGVRHSMSAFEDRYDRREGTIQVHSGDIRIGPARKAPSRIIGPGGIDYSKMYRSS